MTGLRAAALVERHFVRIIAGLVFFYVGVELVYINRLPLVMDEFDGAYEVYRLLRDIPYQDYDPYKTVVGYYISLPAALIASDVWSRLLLMKAELVLITGAALVVAGLFLRRIAAGPAIVLALLLLIINTAFLERSGELRVDMLTALAGFASLLLLLTGRCALSGAACGLSFCISQKGIFYFVAANAALAVELLRARTRKAFQDLLLFNAGFGVVVSLYVGLWSLVSPSVMRTVFLSGASAGGLSAYAIRERFWTQIILRNPMYFVLTAIALAALAVHVVRRGDRTHLLILVYATVVLSEMIVYPQPWPYHFVILLPTTFVLHAIFFDLQRTPERPFGLSPLLLFATVAFGVIYPATRIPVAIARDNSYQEYNVRLAGAILGPDDTYLAGTDIIHNREQTLASLQRLGAPPLAELRAAPPAVAAALVDSLEARPPKLVIGNYRMFGLPPLLLAFINANYVRLSGSILGYAPIAHPGVSTVRIAFEGRYLVDAKSPVPVTINDRQYRSGGFVKLAAGGYTIRSAEPVRLRLLPEELEQTLDPRFAEEQDFYPNVYDY